MTISKVLSNMDPPYIVTKRLTFVNIIFNLHYCEYLHNLFMVSLTFDQKYDVYDSCSQSSLFCDNIASVVIWLIIKIKLFFIAILNEKFL